MNNHIPNYLLRFIRWFFDPELLPSVEGDLIELYKEDVSARGHLKAMALLHWNVIKLIRPELVKSFGIINILMPGLVQSMCRSTIRRLGREKTYVGVNVFGLTMGFLVFFVTVLYTDYERGFDKHLSGYQDVYRLDENWNRSGVEETWAGIKARLTPYILQNYPGVSSTRLFRNGRFELRSGEKKVQTDKVYHVDSTFLDVFPYEAVEGHVKYMLKNPDHVVLTASMAKRVFGDQSALHEIIELNGKSWVVSGVIQDPPVNTHMPFDMLISLNEILPRLNDFHLNDNMWYNYVRVPISQLADLEAGVNRDLINIPGYADDLSIAGNHCEISFTPMSGIHLYGDAERELEANGNAMVVNIIGLIGWFVLFMSGINYVNLAASRSMNRGAEVGIRKIHGSSKTMISAQFLIESVILCALSMAVAAVITYALLPGFNAFFNLGIEMTSEYGLQLLVWALGIAFIFGLLAGAYPALELSRINVMRVLRVSSVNKGVGGSAVRKGFIALQLMISVFTIMSVIIISSQLNFLQNKNLGFERSKRMIIPLNPGNYFEEIGRFKESLVNEPEIGNVTSAFTYPGKRFPFFSFRFPNLNTNGKVQPTLEDGSIWMRTVFGDTDMVETFGLKLISGRNLSTTIPEGPPLEFIVNEAAAKFFGLDNPVGETVELTHNVAEPAQGRIVGLVRDFNYASLHHTVEPMIVFASRHHFSRQFMTITIKDDIRTATQLVEDNWRRYLGNAPLTYSFLDDEYKELYKTEGHLQVFITALAVISVVISIIGLLGMSFYAMEQKKHEIGVRKVLGASVWSILKQNIQEYVYMALLAIAFVLPLTYWFGLSWLNNFAYSVGIGTSVFAMTIGFTLVLVIVSVIYNVLSSALKNPIETIYRG